METKEACVDLNRNQALAVLRLMKNSGFDKSNFFKGLWNTSIPGISYADWLTSNGPSPKIELTIGTRSEMVRRVANYLGFYIEEEVHGAMVPNSLEGKKRLIEQLQAQIMAATGSDEESSLPASNSSEGQDNTEATIPTNGSDDSA